MLFANDYNDNRIHIDETHSNQRLMHDLIFLAGKSEVATKNDLLVAQAM